MKKLLTNRKAVSSMIGGIIILTLFLSALSMMVFISQQYDTYQSTVETMNQKDVDAFSENLVGTYPGLYLNGQENTGACATQTSLGFCNVYYLMISNHAAIGTEVTTIYINSTDNRAYIPGYQGPGVGCVNLCVFGPSETPAPFTFLASTDFVNPSEGNHTLILYTNSTYTLPSNNYMLNSIAIVTTRGRVFSFQWPMPPTGVGSISDLVSGVMQIAYTGSTPGPPYSSANEWAAVHAQPVGSGGTVSANYCHYESNATEVKAGAYGTLWFVDPWTTNTIFKDAFPAYEQTGSKGTAFYVSVVVTNDEPDPITIARGNIWLQTSIVIGNPSTMVVLVVGGPMIGTASTGGGDWNPVSNSTGSSATTVAVGSSVMLIYKINEWNWGSNVWPGTAGGVPSPLSLPAVTFSGMASMTNDEEGSSSPSYAGTYFSGTTIVDGLYVRPGC